MKGGLREGGLMKGRNEAWTAPGKDGREGASGGGIERGTEGARKGRKLQGRYPDPRGGHRPVYTSGGGIERVREGARGKGRKGVENVKRGILRRAQASVQYIHKPFHNAALGLETLVLQMKNSEQV